MHLRTFEPWPFRMACNFPTRSYLRSRAARVGQLGEMARRRELGGGDGLRNHWHEHHRMAECRPPAA